MRNESCYFSSFLFSLAGRIFMIHARSNLFLGLRDEMRYCIIIASDRSIYPHNTIIIIRNSIYSLPTWGAVVNAAAASVVSSRDSLFIINCIHTMRNPSLFSYEPPSILRLTRLQHQQSIKMTKNSAEDRYFYSL